MNDLPILLFALALAAVLAARLRTGLAKALVPGAFAACALLALTLRPLEWQLWPALASLIPLVVTLQKPAAETRPWVRTSFSAAAIAGSTLSLALAWALPVFSLPAPTGPWPIGERPLALTDPATGRELAVTLWYPAQPSPHGTRAPYARPRELEPKFSYQAYVRTDAFEDAPLAQMPGPLPVLLFNPRWNGRRTQDTFLAEDLASHGYVVVAIDHPGNAQRLLTASGRLIRGGRENAALFAHPDSSTPAAIQQVWNRELPFWVRDNRFVLDALAQGAWARGRLDLAHVGAFGHSFGGAASVALLGSDSRVKCAANLDGWNFDALARRTDEPMLFVEQGQDEFPASPTGTESRLDAIDNLLVSSSFARYGGTRAYVAGTQHLSFTDQTLVSPFQRLTHTGPLAAARVQSITRELVLGFFDQTLRHQGTLPRYPEVRLHLFAPRPVR